MRDNPIQLVSLQEALAVVYAPSEQKRIREGARRPPPNYRPADPHDEATENDQAKPVHECGTCSMFDPATSECWGYGNVGVDEDYVCDSWDPDPNWKQQNAAAEETNG